MHNGANGSIAAHYVTRDPQGSVLAVNHRVHADQEIYRLELDKIFGRLWILVGLDLEIPHPGDFKTTYIGEGPVVVGRDQAGRRFSMNARTGSPHQ